MTNNISSKNSSPNSQSLFMVAIDTLMLAEPQAKIDYTNQHKRNWDNGYLTLQKTARVNRIIEPGRPDKPELVLPRNLPRRRLGTIEGRAALIHAVCHIEFNAINLAWDAIYRFQDMPQEYYNNWLQVAYEEAKHFSLLHDYLIELGYKYGSFPAHNGLWELAVDTDYDVLVRMALVPRIMEARGLDVTPAMIKKFADLGDNRAVSILSIILDEELGHVAFGNKWYRYLCEQRSLDPLVTFENLIAKHIKGQIKPPFNTERRLASGFTQEELSMLENINS